MFLDIDRILLHTCYWLGANWTHSFFMAFMLRWETQAVRKVPQGTNGNGVRLFDWRAKVNAITGQTPVAFRGCSKRQGPHSLFPKHNMYCITNWAIISQCALFWSTTASACKNLASIVLYQCCGWFILFSSTNTNYLGPTTLETGMESVRLEMDPEQRLPDRKWSSRLQNPLTLTRIAWPSWCCDVEVLQMSPWGCRMGDLLPIMLLLIRGDLCSTSGCDLSPPQRLRSKKGIFSVYHTTKGSFLRALDWIPIRGFGLRQTVQR